VTEIDHEMVMPTPHHRPEREWDGQRFVYNRAEGAAWQDFRLPGFRCRDTTIAENTKGVAGVEVVRPAPNGGNSPWAAHDSDIHFTFVMAGTVTLEGEGRSPYDLEEGDAFVIPPHMKTRLCGASEDLELLEVTLPGRFETTLD